MKDYDEVMKEFEKKFGECPEMPESLSKENIINRIKQNQIKPKKKKFFTHKMEALAAAVAVIVVAAVVMGQQSFFDKPVTVTDGVGEQSQAVTSPTASTENAPQNETTPETQCRALPEGIYTFDSNESVKEHFAAMYRENGSWKFSYTYGINMEVGVTVAATAAPAANSFDGASDDMATGAVKEESAYTGTNVQLEGVDEGDVIKNDGRYLYILSGGGDYEPRFKIIDTGTMEICYNGKIGKNLNNVIPMELYVNSDTLAVIYSYYEDGEYYYYKDDSTTVVEVYDITDRTSPKKINTATQDGNFNSSRMIGTVLYTVSSYYVQGDDENKVKEYAVPTVNGDEINAGCIYHFDDDSVCYTVLTALDTANGGEKATSLAVLGNAEEIYCSENALYITEPLYEADGYKTKVVSFSLDGTEVLCKAKGIIPGTINNNYSFDEYKGYLRTATTDYDYKIYENVCRIYVLDENLQIVGTSDNLSENEQVKSVRFMGDKGYVVTFRQTDPLFSLDLSDPESPEILGELKLPGYSTYLHPLSESLLMGIGYDGDEENANTSKLKIALFDISDMTTPALLDDFVIENASSQANYETKALIHYAQKNIVGIPVVSYVGAGAVKSFAVISYTDNELSSVEGFLHDTTGYSDIFRGTCIGEMLYTVDRYKIIEHSLSDGEKQRECIITDESEIASESETVKAETTYVSDALIDFAF